jgi:predicted TIM-barrel fold metal-dependent hydrolase
VFAPLAESPMVADRGYTPPPAPLKEYRHMLDVLQLSRAVIVQPSVYGTDNSVTVDAVNALGATARGIAVVDETVSEGELERLHGAGIRGIRLNPKFGGGVGLGAMEALAARIADLGWHIQLLIDARELPDVADRLRALPVAIVIDHMGYMSVGHGLDDPGFRTLLDLVGDGRCWVKLSGAYRTTVAGPPYEDVGSFALALIEAGPSRMVWGTDWPHPAHDGPMPNDGDLLDLLGLWAPDEALRHAILVDNPAALYGFDSRGSGAWT